MFCILLVFATYLLILFPPILFILTKYLKKHENPTATEKKSNPIDDKRAEFRKYLETIMFLTSILIIFGFSPPMDLLLLLILSILLSCVQYLLCPPKKHEKPTAPDKKSNQIDAKEEEFRKYLEREGVWDLLTKSLLPLYEMPDKTTSALEHLKTTVAGKEIEEIKERLASQETEITNLMKTLEHLRTKNSALTSKVAQLKTICDDARQNKSAGDIHGVASRNERGKEIKGVQDGQKESNENDDETTEDEEFEMLEIPRVEEMEEPHATNNEKPLEKSTIKVYECENEEKLELDASNEEHATECYASLSLAASEKKSKSIDAKREEFRRYLEKEGVLESYSSLVPSFFI